MKNSKSLEFFGTSLRAKGVKLLNCKYFYLTVHCKVYSSKLGGQHLVALYSEQEIDRLTSKLYIPSTTINISKKLLSTTIRTNKGGQIISYVL